MNNSSITKNPIVTFKKKVSLVTVGDRDREEKRTG